MKSTDSCCRKRCFDVATLGEGMLLLAATQPGLLEHAHSFKKYTSGAEMNVAIGLSRLGLRASWASRIGDDSIGRYLVKQLIAEGVDVSRVVTARDAHSGIMFKTLSLDGSDPQIEYYRHGSAASRIGPEHIDAAWLQSTHHLHLTGIFPALSATTLAATRRAIEFARESGASISFDPNLRPTLWSCPDAMYTILNELTALCDWVFPGIAEGQFLTRETEPERIAASFRTSGVRGVLLKLGVQGVYYQDESNSGYVDAFAVQRIVDTVGAGDGFAAGAISALIEGRTTAEAAVRGAWVGAQVVQARGDVDGLPYRVQLTENGFQ